MPVQVTEHQQLGNIEEEGGTLNAMIYLMWGLMVLYVWNFVSHKHEAAAIKMLL